TAPVNCFEHPYLKPSHFVLKYLNCSLKTGTSDKSVATTSSSSSFGLRQEALDVVTLPDRDACKELPRTWLEKVFYRELQGRKRFS
ncbi:hypothetical protein HAX54_046345, partial [Datura stramonium]|nr:hypothetical protein [Datura stramonium]